MNVTPKTYLTGCTQPDEAGLKQYLEDTGQLEFLDDWRNAEDIKMIRLVSFYAKLCYKSLVTGKNANVTKLRSIEDNVMSVIKSGHGSVLEHVTFNFVTTDCSRVFTHELVRHRVGTAFSQTSGRYVSIDQLDLVLPPELLGSICQNCNGSGNGDEANWPCKVCHGLGTTAKMIEHLKNRLETDLKDLRTALIPADAPFEVKKRLTSAIRRLAPNGQANEIGWSANVRTLRHLIEMRTSRHAEWEIRYVFNEVAEMMLSNFPAALWGGERFVDHDDPYEMYQWRNLKI